jgi:hypothetical protein
MNCEQSRQCADPDREPDVTGYRATFRAQCGTGQGQRNRYPRSTPEIQKWLRYLKNPKAQLAHEHHARRPSSLIWKKTRRAFNPAQIGLPCSAYHAPQEFGS